MSSERELVRKAKGGDQQAFAALMEQNQTRIYHLALRMTGNPDDALELSQEAFFNAWRGLDRFQEESSFSTWLYRLASNVCIDFLRREKRRRGTAAPLSLDDEESHSRDIPDERYSPHRQVEREERTQLIQEGLEAISPEHRQILLLREMEGLSYGQIAQILGLEEGTVKSRIARARLALRKYLVGTGNFSASSSSTK